MGPRRAMLWAVSDDLASRLRAAVAYKDLKQDAVAAELGIGKRTLGRWLSSADDAEPSPPQRQALIGLTGVPAWFLDEGFPESPPDSGDIQERLALLEREMAWVKRRVGHGAPPPQGKLRRQLADDPPSPEDRSRSHSDPAVDAQRGNGRS